jgi:tripartite-type tricarboxylate transporter receptor subunit TctC
VHIRSIAFVLCAAFAATAQAQSWPSKPVRVMVNVPPGGGIDQITRAIAPRLSETFGQSFVVENRGGAGGIIGLETVAKSAPDGHTLLSAIGSTVVTGPFLYKLRFDIDKDLDPVAPLARTLMFLVARQSLQVPNVAAFLAHARANPGKLNFGSPGVGTGPHIAAEMMLRAAKLQATHVPYKGSAETMAALFGDTIDFAFDPGSAVRHARAGKLRLLAVASAARTPLAPDTPTMAEAGVDVDASTVHGLYAPGGTPRDIVTRLNREVDRILKTDEARKVITAVSAEQVSGTPEEFERQLRRDRQRFGAIIREAEIRAE